MEDFFFSIILPTYKRYQLLRLVLEGLIRQSYSKFNVIIVTKPSDHETENLVKEYRNRLEIITVFQRMGYITEALNLGLKNAIGDIIGFIDDDAIPAVDWLQKHAETYRRFDVKGVAGDVIPIVINKGKVKVLCEREETPFVYPLSKVGYSLWNKPLPGADRYFIYITKSGDIASIGNMAYWRKQGLVRSFLGMGANMTVLREAISGFTFEGAWILGAGWEQVLAWWVWKNGCHLVYNPEAKVFHVIHGQTLSRYLSYKKATLFQAEKELLFYRLYGKEQSLSILYHLISFLYRSALALKKKERHRLKGIVNGNIIGFKWFVLGKLGLSYDVLRDLEVIYYGEKLAKKF
jgi:glycosyltransferase involved in cell wall biosynthesis